MLIKDIKGTSSNVFILFDDKKAILEGELLTDGFLCYVDTLKILNSEGVEIIVNESVKDDIISKSIDEAKKNKFNLVFI